MLIQRLPVREETVQTFNRDIAIDVFESGYRRNVIALIAVSQRGYNGGLIGHINRDGGIGPLPVVGTAVNEAINQNLINILPVATINEEPLTILIVTLTKILLQQQIRRFVIVSQELTQRFGTTDRVYRRAVKELMDKGLVERGEEGGQIRDLAGLKAFLEQP